KWKVLCNWRNPQIPEALLRYPRTRSFSRLATLAGVVLCAGCSGTVAGPGGAGGGGGTGGGTSANGGGASATRGGNSGPGGGTTSTGGGTTSAGGGTTSTGGGGQPVFNDATQNIITNPTSGVTPTAPYWWTGVRPLDGSLFVGPGNSIDGTPGFSIAIGR